MIDIDAIKDGAFYTTEETAKILGVSTRSITNYRVAGKLERISSPNIPFVYTRGSNIKDFLIERQKKKKNKQKR